MDREMALELVSGADFWCNLMSGAGPVDLGGSHSPIGGSHSPIGGSHSPIGEGHDYGLRGRTKRNEKLGQHVRKKNKK